MPISEKWQPCCRKLLMLQTARNLALRDFLSLGDKFSPTTRFARYFLGSRLLFQTDELEAADFEDASAMHPPDSLTNSRR
jgi:hypothetical protein